MGVIKILFSHELRTVHVKWCSYNDVREHNEHNERFQQTNQFWFVFLAGAVSSRLLILSHWHVQGPLLDRLSSYVRPGLITMKK